MALEALEGDVLLNEARRRSAYHLCVRALVMTDHVGRRARRSPPCASMRSTRGSLRMRVAAERYAADLALRTGRVAEAENHARLALDLLDEDINVFTGGCGRGPRLRLGRARRVREARELLRERGLDGELGGVPWEIGVRHARARLWLAEGDFERALRRGLRGRRAARGAGPAESDAGRRGARPPRVALAHLGRRDEAAALADTELALAERFGAPVPIVAALHARAVAEADAEARLALCERALTVAAGSPGSARVGARAPGARQHPVLPGPARRGA